MGVLLNGLILCGLCGRLIILVVLIFGNCVRRFLSVCWWWFLSVVGCSWCGCRILKMF